MTLGKKKKQKQNPLFFCFLCLARRTPNPDGSWHSRKCLGKGCVLSAPPCGHHNSKAAGAFLLALSFLLFFFFFFFFQGEIFPRILFQICVQDNFVERWRGPTAPGRRGGAGFWMLLCLPSLFHERWDELLSLLTEFECWSPNISCARDLFQSLGPPCWMSRMGGFSLCFWGEVAA